MAKPILVLAIVIAALLHASLFLGRGLVPADAMLVTPPWATSSAVTPSNALLTDQYAVFVPVKQFFTDEVRRGRFPLWNPHLSSGVPSLAAMQVAVLYPINLVLTPLGPFAASGLAAFLKLFLAGLFTMMYLRQLGVLPAAALVSGLVFALSGFMIVWLGNPHVNAAVLLPLLLYFLEVQFAGPVRLRPWIGFACAYAVMLLGGHPPTALHITAAVSLYFLFRLAAPGCDARLRRALLAVGALLAGAAVAAPQLLPYLEYYRESSSPLASAALTRWASHLTPATLALFLLPKLAGAPHLGFETLASRLGFGDIDNFNERTGYVGVFTLFLVVVGVVAARQRRIALFHAALAIAALLIVYGVPPFPGLLRALPIVSDVNHQRLLLLVGFSAAVLAGLGLDALVRVNPGSRPRRIAIGFVVAIAVALGLVWHFFGTGIGTGLAGLDAASRSFVMNQLWIVAGGLALAVAVTLPRWPARMVAGVAVGWIAVDLLWFATGYNPAIPRSQYYPATNAIRALQSDTSSFRILGLSNVLLPNAAAVYGLDDVRGKDYTTLKRYEELITGQAGDFFFYESTNRVPPSFPLLNVKYVLVPQRVDAVPDGFELAYEGEIAMYRNTRAAGRALVVFDHEVRSPAEILSRVRSGTFDPSKTVLLEEAPAPVPAAADPSVTSADARIVSADPDRVVVEARLPRTGFLLLLDNYYPGWGAFAAGHELPIHRADYTFRAVALPAGVTTVEFVYRPLSFRIGALTSLAMIGLLMLAWTRK